MAGHGGVGIDEVTVVASHTWAMVWLVVASSLKTAVEITPGGGPGWPRGSVLPRLVQLLHVPGHGLWSSCREGEQEPLKLLETECVHRGDMVVWKGRFRS